LYKIHWEHAKSWTETRRIMEREVLPVSRHLRVVDLKRRDVRELVERKAKMAPVGWSHALDHRQCTEPSTSRMKSPDPEHALRRVAKDVAMPTGDKHPRERANGDRHLSALAL
jgi:hypothetical protein